MGNIILDNHKNVKVFNFTMKAAWVDHINIQLAGMDLITNKEYKS